MADKCIGRLTLDISQVKKDIQEINDWLGKIGANINLEDKLSKGITAALKNLVNEAKKAGEEARNAIDKIGGNGAGNGIGEIKSKIELATGSVKTYVKEIDDAGKATMQLTQTVTTGMDKAGAKIKEVADAQGNIVKRTEEVKRTLEEEIELAYKQAEAQEAAERKKEEASIAAAQKRDEAAQAAAQRELQREQDKADREVAMMDDAVEKQKAALDKQVSDYEKAEERKRQSAINAEFEREEARRKEAAAEEDLIHKEVATMEEAIEKEKAALDKQVSDYEEAEERKRQAAINAEFDREEARKRASQEEIDLIHREVAEMEAALQKKDETALIERAKQAYFDLTDAVKNYNTERNAGDKTGMANAQAKINAAMQEVGAIQEVVNASNIEASVKRQILNYIQQCVTAERQHSVEAQTNLGIANQMSSQVSGLLTRYISLMAVVRAISNLVRNTVEYVSEYSDKMNEIQMITMKTDKEVESLAKTYRDLAAEMSVSSLDMADAAIYFTRQGLGAAEIEKRLKNVTMYAKAANVEFKDASEIITAVVNSMGLVEQEAEDGREAAQRVADVFLNIGDNAATSGQEIGEAMQKAAASAGAFGVSMEWLAAYIATVSETTRQEARTIGTAFNTIIARLHQIKQTGYNQEDETKVNDIAKALSKIDVVLMDQEGNWRDMETILEEIASKWGTLDGKTKSYIATTMAGVKQQNVFLALMNDMSKGAENGSRAFELHEKAMNSDGIAAEKYAVYLDSVAAAQERLKIAQEGFYSLLDESVLKGFYNAMAELVNYFTKATEAANGLNIIIPLIVGGIMMLSAAITALEAHPIVLAITGLIAGVSLLTTLIGSLAGSVETMSDRFQRANKVLSESQLRLNTYFSEQQALKDMIKDIGTETPITSEKLEEYSDLLDNIGSLSATARQAVDDFKNGLIDQTTAAEILNGELEKVIDNEQQISIMSFIQKMATWQPGGTEEEDGLRKSMTNWYDDWTNGAEGAEAFGNQLKQAYEHRKKHVSSIMLDTKTYDYINDILPEGDNVDWGYIGQLVWNKFIGNGKPDSMMNALKTEVDEMINEAINVVGARLNEVEKGTFREMLIQEVLGDDRELSKEEYQSAGKKISTLLYDLYTNGMSNIEVAPDDSLQYIGERFFGNYFSLLFGDQFEALKNDPDFEEASQNISDAVSELIAMGFSDVEIGNLLGSLDLTRWENAAQIMRDRIIETIKEKAHVDVLGLWGTDSKTGEDTLSTMMWDDLDLGVLKLIDDMVTAGVALDDIQVAMSASRSVDEFVEKLHELSEANSTATETTEEETYSLKDLIKAANDGVKDIKALDAAIKSLENKEDIDYGDMLGLAEAHPELLTVIGDTEALLAALKKLRAEASTKQRDALRDMILRESGAMAGSKYKDTGYETLGDYRKSIEGDEEAVKAFDAEVEAMLDNWQKANEDAKKVAKEAKEEAKEAEKTFEDMAKEINTLDKAIKNVESSGGLDMSEMLNIAKAHPELLMLANDTDKLTEALKKLKKEEQDSAKTKLMTYMLDSEDVFKSSEYYNAEFKTMREYLNMLHDSGASGAAQWTEIWHAMQAAAAAIVEGAEETEEAAEAWLEAQMKIIEANDRANWAKSTGYVFQMEELQRALDSGDVKELMATWESFDDKIKEGIADTYPGLISSLYEVDQAAKNIGRDLKQEMADLYKNGNVDLANRKLVDASRLVAAGWEDAGSGTATVYSSDYDAGSQGKRWSKDVMLTLTPITPDGQVILGPKDLEEYVNQLLEDSNSIEELKENDRNRHNLLIGIEEVEDWDTAYDKAEAKAVLLHEMQEEYYGIYTAVDKLNDRMQELGGTIDKMQRIQQAKYFKGTADALLKLEKGTISATDAYDTFYKEVDNVTKAYEEIAAAEEKRASNKGLEESDVNSLAKVLGMTADEIIQDFPAAVDVFNQLIGAGGELRDMFDMLNQSAFIRITGVSEADFSNIENGLFAVRADAQEVIDMLVKTGQWEVASVDLPQEQEVWDPYKRVWTTVQAVGKATVLKAKGTNPFAGASTVTSKNNNKKSSGGGGGGSKNTSNSGMTEVERMLNMMSQVNAIQESQQSYYTSNKNYYKQTGRLQGAIGYSQMEKSALAEQNKTLQANIAQIESYMAKKRQELSTLSVTDEKYKEVSDDLDKLQKAHQQYTKQIIDNKTAIEALKEEIEEYKKQIRQMEIDIRNEIYQAIEDREKKAQDMLNAEIEMENMILDLIKRRYEKERDQIIETTNMKIESLQQERDLLDEQLRIRKEQAEEEDKVQKLRELEAKYQRIIADPTRAKEAQKIRDDIDKLREEMAWDTAEKEVKAQQESIDQQITSLEDYVEYVQNYYEDLFEHPQKLIEEMRGIMQMTQEEIIQWLIQNDEEYAKATENSQKVMRDNWEQTYNDMRGIVKTYWDEVEQIMAQGDAAIIKFLKDHRQDYATAGKLQAQAYVDEWQKKLNDLKKAYEAVQKQIAPNYTTIPPYDGGTGNGGTGGGGGGGGNPDGKAKYRYEATLTYIDTDYGYKIAKGKGESNTSEDEAKKDARTEAMNAARKTGRYRDSVSTTYAKYKKGGLASFTGPAWLDGTPQEPERILSPYQTQLFETMVQALESMSRVVIPSMPNYSGLGATGANPVSVGDIIVNVDNLDTDDDYEDMANKVTEILMDRIGRTAAIGGLRIRSV